ncbi:hypothetical protein HYR99_14715 [Candidatus Poribacteria bacterium]|nr:hypothetical protein [Candidatus Poribacteria bacterium]
MIDTVHLYKVDLLDIGGSAVTGGTLVDTMMKTKSIPGAEEGQAGSQRAKLRRIEGQTLRDHVLYNEADIFSWPEERRQEIQNRLIGDSFSHHYMRCAAYRRLCEIEQFTPKQLRAWSSLARIPLVPSSVFKHRLLHTCPEREIIKVCLSSGTQGSQSRVPRDQITLERFLGTTQTLVDLMLHPTDEAQVFNLGPDTDEAKDLWFAYVMSLLDLILPTTHYVRDGVFYPTSVVAALQALPTDIQPFLVGPPILFCHLLDFMDSRDIRLDLGIRLCHIVTAGGWKRFKNHAIRREALTERLMFRLNLQSPAQVRDAFNMVELNTVLLECEYRRKHIPPWLVVLVREPGTLEPVSEGEVGILSYLDATANSYPGFILSDDFGRVTNSPCPCGRTGGTLEVVRRVNRIEARGCALRMDGAILVADEYAASKWSEGETEGAPKH